MNYKLTKSSSRLDSLKQVRYLPHTLPTATYDIDALSEELSGTLGGGAAEVRYYEECREQAIEAALKSGKTVRIGCVQLMPVVRGGFSSVDGEFDGKVNSVAVASFAYGSLVKCMDGITPENIEKPANPTLSHIREEGADDEEVLASGREITITGRNLKVDVSAGDEGVELVHLKTGETVAHATVEVSNFDSLVVSFAALPPAGRYALAVRTRAGLDREHKVVTAMREIKVVDASAKGGEK